MGILPDPKGRRLLRVEVRNVRTLTKKKPEWIRAAVVTGQSYQNMCDFSRYEGPHTVCAEVGCPNIYEC